jgi:hypothetical protein
MKVTDMTSPITREAWLLNAIDKLKPIFKENGFLIPAVQISCGFPSSGARTLHIGECWDKASSEHGVNEIFIHPSLDDPVLILDTITHELVHVVDDCKSKHGKEFKEIALKIGLEGPMRSASAGEKLKERLERIVPELGPYPHGKMTIMPKFILRRPRPRAKCSECGYEITPLKKWLHLGPPICPLDKIEMLPVGEWGDAQKKL